MNLPVSRRHFLGTSAGSAAALTSGPLIVQAGALPSQKVTVGIMGLNRGMQVINALEKQPGVVIKYVCDVDSKRADKGKADLDKGGIQHPQAITDFRRILDDKDVDALFIEAPNHWHAPATILACKAGKHVYVEKPCSHNPWEGEQMIAAAKSYDRAVQMGVQRRSTPGVIEAMTKLHEGVIGNVYCARSWYNNHRPSLGKGKQVDPPKNLDYELWQGPAPRTPYLEQPHPLQLALVLALGERRARQQRCPCSGPVPLGVKRRIPHPRHLLRRSLPLPRRPANARYARRQFRVSRAASRSPGKTSVATNIRDSTGYITFYGDKGALSLGEFGDYKIHSADDRVIFKRPDDAGKQNPWFAVDTFHTAHFIDKIRKGDHFGLSAQIEKGHRSTLLCHLGNIAYRTQRTLKCNPENGHILDDEPAMAYWQREYEPGWKPVV